MSIKERKDVTDEEILYEYYSLDSLKYLIDMLSELKVSLERLLPKNDSIYGKKILIFRFEIIARFCQLAESLGGLITGYNKLNINSNNELSDGHATIIIKSLSEYQEKDIISFYKNVLNNSFNYKFLFGYDILSDEYEEEILRSINNIRTSLDEISDCYLFFKDSYNAYKHGYRLWVGKDQMTNIEAAIFRNKKGTEDHIPLDDKSLDLVIKSGRYCLNLFDILKFNHKSIFYHLLNTQKQTLTIKFLLNLENPTENICSIH